MYGSCQQHKCHAVTAALFSLALVAGCERSMVEGPAERETATAQTEPEAGTNSEVVSEIEDTAAAVIGTLNAEFTETTQGFAEVASLNVMYEIAAAETAVARSDNSEVKEFAQSVLDSNSAMQAELAEVIEASHIPVQLPTELDARHQGMLDNLNGASDENFETRFITQQVNAHSEMLTLTRNYAEDGRSPPIREFAADIISGLEQRLARAQALDESLSEQSGG